MTATPSAPSLTGVASARVFCIRSSRQTNRSFQLNLYALAVREKTGSLPEKVSLLYLENGKMVDYIPDDDSVSAFLEEAGALLDRIFAGDFEPRESFNCRNCDYRILCGE